MNSVSRYLILMLILAFSCKTSIKEKQQDKVIGPLKKARNEQPSSAMEVYSLEGKRVQLSIQDIPWSNVINCILPGKDSFCIQDYTGMVDSPIVTRNFLILNYSVRGGSGVKFEKTTVFTVSNDKIINCLDYFSLERDMVLNSKLKDSIIIRKEIKLSPNNKMEVLGVQLLETYFEKNENKVVKNKASKFQLFFDSAQKMFFNKYVVLKGFYYIDKYLPNYIKLNDTVKSIMLNQDTTVRINGEWFKKMGGELMYITNRCE